MGVDFSQRFFASIEMFIWFLSFNLLIWYIIWFDFHILKNPSIPRINPIWSLCMSFLMCCWILFAKILLRIFASMFFSDTGLQFSFFLFFFLHCQCLAFGIRVMVASWNEFGNVPSSAIFWKSFRKIGISSSLNIW